MQHIEYHINKTGKAWRDVTMYGYSNSLSFMCSNHVEALNQIIKKIMHFVCIFECTTIDRLKLLTLKPIQIIPTKTKPNSMS